MARSRDEQEMMVNGVVTLLKRCNRHDHVKEIVREIRNNGHQVLAVVCSKNR